MNHFRLNRRPIILLLAGLLLVLNGCTFLGNKPSTPDSPPKDPDQVPTILMEDQPFTPDPGAIMQEGRLYLPFIESLGLLKIQTEDYPGMDALSAYHDNRFLKVDTEQLTMTLNGKPISRSQPPLLIDRTLYVPAAALFDAFNFEVAYPADGVVSLRRRENIESSQLVDGEYFIPIAVKEYDLQFSVPKLWSRLPGAPYRFGEESGFEDFQITFSAHPLDGRSDHELLERLAAEAAKEAGVTLQELETAPLNVNGLEGYTVSFRYEGKGDEYYTPAGQMTQYLFKREETAYVFQGWIHDAVDPDAIRRQITGVARSLRFGDMAVDVQREHYIEAPAFFENEVVLSTPLYSNMEVRNRIELSGTLGDGSINWLYAAVTRGGETLTQAIPVKDKAFSGIIHAPFGLGKHDITLYAAKNDPHPQDRILQVSVVNTSPRETRWMIPSQQVDADSEYITSQSSLLTYKTYGDYMKARQLFSWVIENVTLKPSDRKPDTASKVYVKSAGSEAELVILYTAMLRATEIPARIMTTTGETPHVWVEMQMNGQWVASDPVAAIRRMKDGAPLKEAVDAHFNMSQAYFTERYADAERLSW